jgi:hypothetical protein
MITRRDLAQSKLLLLPILNEPELKRFQAVSDLDLLFPYRDQCLRYSLHVLVFAFQYGAR